MKTLRTLPNLAVLLLAVFVLIKKVQTATAQTIMQVGADTMAVNQVWIGNQIGFLSPDPQGWQLARNARFTHGDSWPRQRIVGRDTLVLETKSNHRFRVENDKGIPFRGLYIADAYRYIPIDSSLIQVPRWQWRRVMHRLDRIEQVNN